MATSPTPNLRPNPLTPHRLYEIDGYTWALQQAVAVRGRNVAAIDWENVAEELEELARQHRSQWTKFCTHAIEHLLKIEHYPTPTVSVLRHWQFEVMGFRDQMAKIRRSNPGLQGKYGEMLEEAWDDGRALARRRLTEYTGANIEAGIEEPISGKKLHHLWDRRLPHENPYSLQDVTAFDRRTDKRPREDLWPPAVAIRLNTVLGTEYEFRREPSQSRELSS